MSIYVLTYLFLFWLPWTACRTSIPQPGVEPQTTAVKMLNPNYEVTKLHEFVFRTVRRDVRSRDLKLWRDQSWRNKESSEFA